MLSRCPRVVTRASGTGPRRPSCVMSAPPCPVRANRRARETEGGRGAVDTGAANLGNTCVDSFTGGAFVRRGRRAAQGAGGHNR
jgi:hypothetical protein